MRLAFWMVVGAALFVGSAGAVLACDTCTTMKATDGWCKSCSVGYFNDIKVDAASLHQQLKGSSAFPTCKTCVSARKINGTCKTCQVYFYGGVKYTSAFAGDLEKGVTPKTLKCKSCITAQSTDGFCSASNVGYIDQRQYRDANAYTAGLTAKARIKGAGTLKCETCAVAHLFDGSCKTCRLVYKGGVATPMPDPAPKSKG